VRPQLSLQTLLRAIPDPEAGEPDRAPASLSRNAGRLFPERRWGDHRKRPERISKRTGHCWKKEAGDGRQVPPAARARAAIPLQMPAVFAGFLPAEGRIDSAEIIISGLLVGKKVFHTATPLCGTGSRTQMENSQSLQFLPFSSSVQLPFNVQ